MEVAWGGASGAYEEGGLVTVATTSNGDRRIDPTDTFVTVMQNARRVDDPMSGPSGHGPSAHVLGGRRGVLTAAGDMYADPFSIDGPARSGAPRVRLHVHRAARPDDRARDVRREGAERAVRVARPGPGANSRRRRHPAAVRRNSTIPAPGSEIARVTAIARRLVDAPDLRGLTARQRSQIANWNVPSAAPRPSFSVFEKTAEQLQDALTRGETTSEDIVRDYLSRLSRYDRNGPSLRSMLALNPRVVADARASDAERAAGRVRGPFHGIPVAYKDNIDVLGLPTTGGSRALVDHQPRLDSRMAAAMRAAGAIVLGKANLDEFPFGDFGISSVAGTIGNAYDPSLSTAGSSGGSAVAVSTSLVPLAFGTDTCNSLSNPAAFASLATIRTTRGLTSRAGVMPLNPYNDAVGPMAKSVREVALVLDQVAGTDPEDAVTQDAGRHISGSFTADLSPAALKGARIGLLRQRFVGFTGEREIATLMETVAGEIRAAGGTVVEVNVPDIEARYRAARGAEPGALKAAWNAYLSRGAKPGEKVLTIEDLLASGKLAPGSARRFEGCPRADAGRRRAARGEPEPLSPAATSSATSSSP